MSVCRVCFLLLPWKPNQKRSVVFQSLVILYIATLNFSIRKESGHVMLTWMSHDLKTATNLVLEKAGKEAMLCLHTVRPRLD